MYKRQALVTVVPSAFDVVSISGVSALIVTASVTPATASGMSIVAVCPTVSSKPVRL